MLSKRRLMIQKIGFMVLWIVIWQLLSMLVGSKLLLAGPWDTLCALKQLLQEPAKLFGNILNSFFGIFFGYGTGTLLGILLASLSVQRKWLQELLKPPIMLMKSVPIASFVILALVWVGSERLSFFIALMMSFPILYSHMLISLSTIDQGMLEMAKIYSIAKKDKWRFIIIPAVQKQIGAALVLAYGMCWKAGIAAELIGVPMHSIGEELYYAKVYMETARVFAWTAVILMVCVGTQHLLCKLLRHFLYQWTRSCDMEDTYFKTEEEKTVNDTVE